MFQICSVISGDRQKGQPQHPKRQDVAKFSGIEEWNQSRFFGSSVYMGEKG
jgi:hypothetical protein